MARNYLVTGGAGFIGSNFIEHLAQADPDASVTNLGGANDLFNDANRP